MSRSEKHSWWLDRNCDDPACTGERGNKYRRTLRWLKRTRHKDARRQGKADTLEQYLEAARTAANSPEVREKIRAIPASFTY